MRLNICGSPAVPEWGMVVSGGAKSSKAEENTLIFCCFYSILATLLCLIVGNGVTREADIFPYFRKVEGW